MFKKGPIQSVYRKREVHQVTEEDVEEETEENLYTMTESKTKGTMIPVLIEDIEIELQLDTGCSLSLIYKSLYEKKFSRLPLQPTDVILFTYTGEKVSPPWTDQSNR